jgi:hypothetical protein
MSIISSSLEPISLSHASKTTRLVKLYQIVTARLPFDISVSTTRYLPDAFPSQTPSRC